MGGQTCHAMRMYIRTRSAGAEWMGDARDGRMFASLFFLDTHVRRAAFKIRRSSAVLGGNYPKHSGSGCLEG